MAGSTNVGLDQPRMEFDGKIDRKAKTIRSASGQTLTIITNKTEMAKRGASNVRYPMTQRSNERRNHRYARAISRDRTRVNYQ